MVNNKTKENAMQVKVKFGDTILLSLGGGLFREISYDRLKDNFERVKKYNQTKVGAVSRAVKLYDYAKRNGKFTNGAKTTPESLARMASTITGKIMALDPHEHAQFKGWMSK